MKISNLLRKYFTSATALLAAALLFVGVAFVFINANASGAPSLSTQASPLHPLFPLLDEGGENVLDSGASVSTMQTCGACHDAEFIQEHSYHSSQGIEDLTDPGTLPGSRAWDTSPGLFGRWSPIAYRYLTPQGDEIMDLGTAGWIMTYGPRHVGGGPAAYAPDGIPLTELEYVPGDPQTNLLDPESGEVIPWDWEESGVVEMNCFLCHTDAPDNEARIEALHRGEFGWANTATLLGSGVVSRVGDTYQWNPDAFDAQGNVSKESLVVQDPDNDNCAACHGLVHDNLSEPLTISGCDPASLRTVTTGQIISPQRLSDTGMNLDQKDTLTRPWDIHADRLVSCTDCHYSLNNPVYAQESEDSRPEHLIFDPRRLDLGEYLYQPLHQFARGQSAHNTVAPQLRDTMRRCDSCHSIEATHEWLPYKERHTEALSCETCHIPEMYSNALMQYDWTVITTESTGVNACRGIDGDPNESMSLITGFEPVLLPKENIDGETQLAPFNLVTAFYWVHGDPPRPVRLADLEVVYLTGDQYSSDVITAFDADGDGQLSKAELRIDTQSKVELIKGKLEGLGLTQVRIQGEIQPYSINHTVATGDWVLRECESCHSQDSRITRSFQVATHLPGGIEPQFVGDSNTLPAGEFVPVENGGLKFKPDTQSQGLYVLGLDAVGWIDLLGGFAFLGVLVGVSVHGGIRVYNASRSKPKEHALERVYMYGIYERLWHWLQTVTIVGLLFTGLIIHRPDVFGLFSFRYVVLVHNILAAILVINAGLALFYHLASGQIRQFIPRPYGFFDQAITQAKYYLGGIFKGDPHPFEKTPAKKLNPLQQITYFSILNILLPVQVITGALMWGAQQWPQIADSLGGLPFLAPFHSLVAWLFAAFIVLHVYLTTTGHKPLTAIKAMVDGWDEVEKNSHSNDEEEV